MKVIAMIPARYAATRFPAKLMQVLGHKTVIRHTYDAVVSSGLFAEVFVVTDSQIIFDEITAHNGKAIMSKASHESGSDRIAEAVADMDVDVIINVQGDEPFIQGKVLETLVSLFNDPAVEVGSLMRRFEVDEDVSRPGSVKVVTDINNDSLYFSRSVIPYPADASAEGSAIIPTYLHIGVYGFRKKTLIQFTSWLPGRLERVEKLEQLRYLERGIKIRMAEVDFKSIAIDTPEDLEKAKLLL